MRLWPSIETGGCLAGGWMVISCPATIAPHDPLVSYRGLDQLRVRQNNCSYLASRGNYTDGTSIPKGQRVALTSLKLGQPGFTAIAKSSDQDLLERFIASGDEAAFAGLVRRHSRTVWSVCRRVLAHEQDAEDAFQAVFIVLARKAGLIRQRGAIGSWLYGVAYRVAMRARHSANCRLDRERPVEEPLTTGSPCSEAAFRELQAILDEEVQRLRPKYREAFTLCCLQGLSKTEAARVLGCKAGTVSSQVTRARQLLQKRLARRGISITSALAVVALSPSLVTAAPDALVHTTIQGLKAAKVTAQLSPAALALADGFVRLLAGTKLNIGLAVFLTLLTLAAGTGWAAHQLAGQTDPKVPGLVEEPEECYYDFRGSKPLPAAFMRVGVEAQTIIQPEDAGLRITTPANRKRSDKAGVKLTHRLAGDFEITTGFELLHADEPTGQRGVGFSLYLTTAGPRGSAWSV
jgi:RNA polymerase sigma factor (sigma-70 family)